VRKFAELGAAQMVARVVPQVFSWMLQAARVGELRVCRLLRQRSWCFQLTCTFTWRNLSHVNRPSFLFCQCASGTWGSFAPRSKHQREHNRRHPLTIHFAFAFAFTSTSSLLSPYRKPPTERLRLRQHHLQLTGRRTATLTPPEPWR